MSLKAYVKSMRPYYFFVSGTAGWLGIIYSGSNPSFARTLTILLVMFLGWGVNQVINDLLGLQEDKINAPERPLVTGELPIKTALILSVLFFILGGIITYALNPWALLLYIFIFALNIIYEYSKAIPVIGNIIFGFLIAPCVYYGALCSGNYGMEMLYKQELVIIAISVFLINFVLCYFTYFKDYEGDKKAGKETLVVMLKPENVKYFNFLFSISPFIISIILILKSSLYTYINFYFIILFVLAFITMQYTAYLFYKYYQGKQTYFSLKWNFIGAVLFQVSFIALLNPALACVLFITSLLAVYFLFNMYKNHLV